MRQKSKYWQLNEVRCKSLRFFYTERKNWKESSWKSLIVLTLKCGIFTAFFNFWTHQELSKLGQWTAIVSYSTCFMTLCIVDKSQVEFQFCSIPQVFSYANEFSAQSLNGPGLIYQFGILFSVQSRGNNNDFFFKWSLLCTTHSSFSSSKVKFDHGTVNFSYDFCFASKHQAFIACAAKVILRMRQLMIWH